MRKCHGAGAGLIILVEVWRVGDKNSHDGQPERTGEMKQVSAQQGTANPKQQLVLLTARVQAADKLAGGAEQKVRLAKSKFKAARKVFKQAKKAAKKIAKQAKRLRKELAAMQDSPALKRNGKPAKPPAAKKKRRPASPLVPAPAVTSEPAAADPATTPVASEAPANPPDAGGN
jgi:hypothetical protein